MHVLCTTTIFPLSNGMKTIFIFKHLNGDLELQILPFKSVTYIHDASLHRRGEIWRKVVEPSSIPISAASRLCWQKKTQNCSLTKAQYTLPVFMGRVLETDRSSVSVSITAPKLEIFLVSVTAVIVKHGFGLLSVTAETTSRFQREPKLSLLSIRQLRRILLIPPLMYGRPA